MKRLKLFSFTLLGLLLIASLSFFTSACQQEEAVGVKTGSVDQALLADLAGRYYQRSTAEQWQADGEARMKLTREQSDWLLDKLLEEEIRQFKAVRAAQPKEQSGEKAEGEDLDKAAPLTDQEFAGVLQAAGAANELKKRANKEAFEKFNRNFFTLSEGEKLQLGSFQSLGIKPIATASARTACGAYCTTAACPTVPGGSSYATVYAAGATATINLTTPSSYFSTSASAWHQASDYCGGDCDFVYSIGTAYFAAYNTYVTGVTQPGDDLLKLFGGSGGRLSLGFKNFTTCGAYSTPNHIMIGTGRCKLNYATTDINLIRSRLGTDIGYFYRPK